MYTSTHLPVNHARGGSCIKHDRAPSEATTRRSNPLDGGTHRENGEPAGAWQGGSDGGDLESHTDYAAEVGPNRIRRPLYNRLKSVVWNRWHCGPACC